MNGPELHDDAQPYSWQDGRYVPTATRPATCPFGLDRAHCSPAYLCRSCIHKLITDVQEGRGDV